MSPGSTDLINIDRNNKSSLRRAFGPYSGSLSRLQQQQHTLFAHLEITVN